MPLTLFSICVALSPLRMLLKSRTFGALSLSCMIFLCGSDSMRGHQFFWQVLGPISTVCPEAAMRTSWRSASILW